MENAEAADRGVRSMGPCGRRGPRQSHLLIGEGRCGVGRTPCVDGVVVKGHGPSTGVSRWAMLVGGGVLPEALSLALPQID